MEKIKSVQDNIFFDPNEIFENLTEISKRTQHILSILNNRQQELSQEIFLYKLANITNMYQDFFQKLAENPTPLITPQISYWQDVLKLWHKSVLHWLEGTKPVLEQKKENDKRFQDSAWATNPFFSFLKEYYLLTTHYVNDVVNQTEGLDPKTTKKINFYTKQFINALSPSNFIPTNPDVLRTTIKTGGKNLLDGFNNMLADLERGEGQFNIKMTDLNAFKIGENIAATPGKIIYQNDLMQLIQYKAQTDTVYQRPLLMISAWINKYYILDLSQHNSLVNWMVQQGYTVFMISWINPDQHYAHKNFYDYMSEGPLTALDIIESITTENKINILGFCLGGTLLAATLAYLAAHKKNRIASATYLATLIDFSDAGDMSIFTDENEINLLEREMQQKGYLDGSNLSLAFNMLRPNDLIWSYFVNNYLQGAEPFPFDILYWNMDSTNMPATMHSFYLRNMYLNNLLVKPNGIQLADTPLDLSKIKTPTYFLSTQFDHIAPWKTTYKGALLNQNESTFVLGGSGHIAGVINPPAMQKYYYYTNSQKPSDSDDWLTTAKKHTGSWWPHWEKWLRKFSGEKIPAQQTRKRALSFIEDAPGTYVKIMLKDIRSKCK